MKKMHRVARYASLLMAVLMLCTACSKGGENEGSTTPPAITSEEETTAAETDAPKERLVIAENGKTDFGLILPDEANGTYLSLFSSLCARLRKNTAR